MIIHRHEMELLSELVRTNLDVEAAFTVCAHKTDSEQLCAMLLARALVCGHAARELTEMLNARGSKVREDESWKEVSAPDWMALHTALVEHNDAAVREECARTEDETLMRFRDTLEHDLPADIRRVVENHFAALLQYCGRLREVHLPPATESGASHHHA